jgi:hypothetical protein
LESRRRAAYGTERFEYQRFDASCVSGVVEDPADGASWTEIDRGEKTSDLSSNWAVKTFAIAWSERFHGIRLRETGPNHKDSNCLVLGLFGVFGAVTWLQ